MARLLAFEAYALLTAIADDLAAFGRPAAAPDANGALALDAVLSERSPNCPLPPPQYLRLFVARLEELLGRSYLLDEMESRLRL